MYPLMKENDKDLEVVRYDREQEECQILKARLIKFKNLCPISS